MAAINRMSMAQQLNEQVDGQSILDGILEEVATASSAFTGVGADVAKASLAQSKEDTAKSRTEGLVARKGSSDIVKAAFTDPNASDVRDLFAVMRANEKNNEVEIAKKRSEMMAQTAVAPLDENTSPKEKFLRTGVPPTVQAKRSDINSALEEAIGTDTSLTQSPDSINTDEKRAEDAQYLSGSGLSIDDRFPDDETATTGFMSRPATPDYLASSDSTLEANIKEVQSLLGFTGREVDGNFGKNSKKELKAFQKRAGLPVTDNFTYDPATVEALKKANANIETATQGFLDKVAYGEGAKAGDETDYEIVYGQGTVDYLAPEIDGISTSPSGSPNRPLKITEMTFAQLYNYQNKMITGNTGKIRGKTAEGKGSSAAGKYQITRDSLFGKNGTPENPKANSWAGILKLDENTVFTPEIQERIGRLALKQSGFYNWLYNKNGGKSESNMLNGVARIWASVEGSTADQGTQTTQASLEPYLKVLRNRGVSD